MIRVEGGFFWAREDGASITVTGEGNHLVVRDCRFVARPKRWWHLRAWYRAWRLWLGHNDHLRNPWLQ